MKDSRKKLLQMIYDHDQTTGRPLQIRADGSDTGNDFHTLRNDVTYLKANNFVFEPMPIMCAYVLSLTEKGEYLVENGFKQPPNFSTSNIFNIENATNSVIGTQTTVTLNINNAIQEARTQVESCQSDDKAELHQIINLLEMITSEQVPVKKGLFSKFSGIIQRNSWIASPITSILLNWLTTL